MSVFTRLAAAIFAANDGGGNPRQVDNGECVTWGTEVETAINGLIGKAPAIAANRTQLKALDTAIYKYAFVAEGDRAGYWAYDGGDVSSMVSPRSLSSSAVSGDEITITGHRLRDGDSVIATSAVNGLSTNTYYYAIRVDANTLSLATSRTNAIDGSALSLSGTSAMTLKIVPDDLEGTVVFKSGAALDGSGGAWLRVQRRRGEWDASHFGCVVGNSSDNAPAIRCAMHTAEEAGGGLVLLPAGSIYMVRGLRARRQVWLQGCGKQATILDFRGNGTAVALDCLDDGTDGIYPYDRTICGFRAFTVDGTNVNPSSDLKGAVLGGNYRSARMFDEVKFMQTPGDGVYFAGPNWNIDLVDIEYDTCGRFRSAAAGIRNDPAIDALNHINFTRNRVEGCGNSSSNAGGVNLTFNDIGPRGFQFTDCQAEGNFGSDECFFSKVTGLYINGFYVETLNLGSVNRAGIEATDCTGHIHGAQMYADAGTPKQAFKFNGASKFTVMDADVGDHWATALIEANDTSVIRYANLNGSASNVANGSATITLM